VHVIDFVYLSLVPRTVAVPFKLVMTWTRVKLFRSLPLRGSGKCQRPLVVPDKPTSTTLTRLDTFREASIPSFEQPLQIRDVGPIGAMLAYQQISV
jgi:hypothetical protein